MIKRHHLAHSIAGAIIVLVAYFIPILTIWHGIGGVMGWYGMKEILQYIEKKHNRSHLWGHIEDWLYAVFGAIAMALLMTLL